MDELIKEGKRVSLCRVVLADICSLIFEKSGFGGMFTDI